MANGTYPSAAIPVSVEQLNHWLIAVRSAIDVIMDVYPDLQDPLQPAEQLVVTAIHQLSLTEDALLQVLGQELGYVPSHLVDATQ